MLTHVRCTWRRGRASSMAVAMSGSGQREHDHGITAFVVKLRIAAGRHGNVLLAVNGVGYRRRVHAGTALEFPELLARRCIECAEQPVSFAIEYKSPGSDEHAADQRLLSLVIPRDLAGIDIDRGQLAPLRLRRNGLECATQP